MGGVYGFSFLLPFLSFFFLAAFMLMSHFSSSLSPSVLSKPLGLICCISERKRAKKKSRMFILEGEKEGKEEEERHETHKKKEI